MKLLAIDASGQVASVALCQDKELIAEYTINYKKTHSQTLLPMIDEVLKMTETDRKSLEGIVVSKGPGSFTGLRIGGATAKGLCNALSIPCAGISTLKMLAANYIGQKDVIVLPIMDARRNQVYAAAYNGDELTSLLDEGAYGIEQIVEFAEKADKRCIFLGDGVKVYRKFIEEKLTDKADFDFAPMHMCLQRAGSLAVLGELAFSAGETCSGEALELEYLRMSQAERERMERNSAEAQNA